MGFYNIAVTDGHGRTVYLDQKFDPSVVEEAIDYLSGQRLQKKSPTDVFAYLQADGPTSLVERVFSLSSTDAFSELERLEKFGRAKRLTLRGELLVWLIPKIMRTKRRVS